MSKAQEQAIREYVAVKLEIATDEAAELLGVSQAEAQAILDGMPEYVATPKAYRGNTAYPNVYHAPLGPDPRDRGDGTRDNGMVAAHNIGQPYYDAPAGAVTQGIARDATGEPLLAEPFRGRRAMGAEQT